MIALTIFLGEFLSPGHLIIILAVVLLLFGGKKIPELMKGLGSGVKEFKNASREDQPADSKKDELKE
jgi:sec-independent protein translocase protein TatA